MAPHTGQPLQGDRCRGFGHPARQEADALTRGSHSAGWGFLTWRRWGGGGGGTKVPKTLNPQAGQGSSQPSEGQGRQPPVSWSKCLTGWWVQSTARGPAHGDPTPQSTARGKLPAEARKDGGAQAGEGRAGRSGSESAGLAGHSASAFYGGSAARRSALTKR